MKDFDKTVDELYQLCRRVQKETDVEVAFSVANYETGNIVNVNIYDVKVEGAFATYNIVEDGYGEKVNAKKAMEHLNRLLIEKPCPYCEEKKHGE